MSQALHYRPLKAAEREILEKLLEPEFPGRDELRRQLDSVTARQVDDDGSLDLQVGASRPAPVKYRVPTEGECPDADGIMIHVLLHIVNGALHELEIYKEDSSKVLRPPTARALILFSPA